MAQYRLLIADDEEIARKALHLLIRKELPEIEILQDATNGIELVALVQELKPDIAIVDVNMPGMSGIEAVDLLCARDCKTHFIIHTAYDEFDYVQKALNLKVDAYLLKPSKRANTVETIRKTCSQISAAKQTRQSNLRVNELFSRIVPIMESEIMYSLFIGEPAVSSFESYCDIYGLKFSAGAVATLIPWQNGSEALRQTDRQELHDLFDEALGGSCSFLTAVTGSNICLLLLIPADIPEEQRQPWLEDVLHVLTDSVARHYHAPLRVGVGRIYTSFREMETSYRESHMAILESGGDGCAFYREPEADQQAEGKLRELAEMIRRGNLQKIDLLLRESARDSVRKQTLWKHLCAELEPAVREKEELAALTERISRELTVLPDEQAETLHRGVYSLVGLCSHSGADEKEPDKGYVAEALAYIDAHYQEDVSLEETASVCGVSSYYLSRQFKAEQGETFVEYLTKVRMEAAKQLALETRFSIREIAEHTGYNNPTYFCRVFKKYTGCTISEFRENNRK